MIGKSHVRPPDTSRNTYTCSSPAVRYSEWIHMLTHARIFSCWGKTGMRSLSFSLLISFHTWRQFTTIYPRHHFHFLHSLSHHAPSFLLSTLTPFPPFLLLSLSSISVSAWWVSSSGPPLSLSLLPSVIYLFAFAIIFVLEIKWSYFSA